MTRPDLDALTAVVFDCDGTLVDSERVSRAAMAQVLAEDGHTMTDEDHHAVIGHAWPRIEAFLVELMGYDGAGLRSYRDRVTAAFLDRLGDVVVFDDVADTVAALHAAGVPMAVCTSSGRDHLDRKFAMPGLAGRFAASVAREDTDEHKPLPAPYLLAARRLGVDPTRCVVVEDTPTGIASGRAAGMRVLAVDRGLGLDLSGADRVVERVSVDALVEVVAGQRAT